MSKHIFLTLIWPGKPEGSIPPESKGEIRMANLKNVSFNGLVKGRDFNKEMYYRSGDESFLDRVKQYEEEIEAREWAVVISVKQNEKKQWEVFLDGFSLRIEKYKKDAMAYAKKVSKDYEYFTIEDQKVRAAR